MTHSLDDALVERLRHRAVARLSLKRPTKTDRYDAELDNSAADRIAALEAAGVAELRDEIERLREALVDLRKLAMDDHWGTPKVCWEIIESIDAALTNQGKAQG